MAMLAGAPPAPVLFWPNCSPFCFQYRLAVCGPSPDQGVVVAAAVLDAAVAWLALGDPPLPHAGSPRPTKPNKPAVALAAIRVLIIFLLLDWRTSLGVAPCHRGW